MIEEQSGWFVVNVRDANWSESASFGRYASFEGEGSFEQTGVGLAVLEPGKPNCHYHRENAQENFLVLSGTCLLLVNGEERQLGPWDFVHCPPGVTHVFVGTGDGPCVVVMIGHRPKTKELFYPQHPLAAQHQAQSPEPTPDPRVSYADAKPRLKIDPPSWPLD